MKKLNSFQDNSKKHAENDSRSLLFHICDIALVSIGDDIRWKTKPRIVILYAILVAMMGMVSILLIIVQRVVLHTWCTLCFIAAALSLSMVLPVIHEFLATWQLIKG